MITSDLVTNALESFPRLSEMEAHVQAVARGEINAAMAAVQEDIDFAKAFITACDANEAFTAFTAHMRELYFQNSMTAHTFVNIARCYVQLGYRLHSLELASDFHDAGL